MDMYIYILPRTHIDDRNLFLLNKRVHCRLSDFGLLLHSHNSQHEDSAAPTPYAVLTFGCWFILSPSQLTA